MQCLIHVSTGEGSGYRSIGPYGGRPHLSALRTLVAGIVGLLGGAIAGLAVQFSFGVWSLFVGLLYGVFVGHVVLRVCGYKDSSRVEVLAGVAILVGALAARVLAALRLSAVSGIRPPWGVFSVLVDLVVPSLIPIISLVLVVAGFVVYIRHFSKASG
ncbi:MAG: hypothetical protein ACUVRS_00405 [Armatimonadota bacterium]